MFFRLLVCLLCQLRSRGFVIQNKYLRSGVMKAQQMKNDQNISKMNHIPWKEKKKSIRDSSYSIIQNGANVFLKFVQLSKIHAKPISKEYLFCVSE